MKGAFVETRTAVAALPARAATAAAVGVERASISILAVSVAVLLIAVRTYRLIFHPELMKKPDELTRPIE